MRNQDEVVAGIFCGVYCIPTRFWRSRFKGVKYYLRIFDNYLSFRKM